MARPCRLVSLIAAACVALVFTSTGGAQQAGLIVASDAWLDISTIHLTVTGVPGHDSFAVKGSFGFPPEAITLPPQSVTFSLAPDNFVLSTWAEVGRGRIYRASANGVTAEINYWIGGSSRCTFEFVGAKQDLSGVDVGASNAWQMVVALAINGVAFQQSQTLYLAHSGKSYIGKTFGPVATVIIDSVLIKMNHTKPNADTVVVKFRIWNTDFDPPTDDLTLNLGNAYSVTLPAGSLVYSHSGWSASCKHNLPGHGTMAVVWDLKKGYMTITLAGVDVGYVSWCPIMGMTIGGVEPWLYHVYMLSNSASTMLKY